MLEPRMSSQVTLRCKGKTAELTPSLKTASFAFRNPSPVIEQLSPRLVLDAADFAVEFPTHQMPPFDVDAQVEAFPEIPETKLTVDAVPCLFRVHPPDVSVSSVFRGKRFLANRTGRVLLAVYSEQMRSLEVGLEVGQAVVDSLAKLALNGNAEVNVVHVGGQGDLRREGFCADMTGFTIPGI